MLKVLILILILGCLGLRVIMAYVCLNELMLSADRRVRIDQLIGYAAKPLTAPDACDPNGQRLSPFSWEWDWDTQLTSRQLHTFCTVHPLPTFLVLMLVAIK
jgi:hypothetical protein